MASSPTGCGTHYTTQESLQALQVISGKIKKESDLNNIHWLAGVVPPGAWVESHKTRFVDTHARIDSNQLKATRISLRKSVYSLNTLKDLRRTMD